MSIDKSKGYGDYSDHTEIQQAIDDAHNPELLLRERADAIMFLIQAGIVE